MQKWQITFDMFGIGVEQVNSVYELLADGQERHMGMQFILASYDEKQTAQQRVNTIRTLIPRYRAGNVWMKPVEVESAK